MRAVILVGPKPPPSGGVASHVDDLARLVRDRGVRAEKIGLARGRAAALKLFVTLGRARLDRSGETLIHLHTNGHNPGSWRLAWMVGLATGGRGILTLHSGLAPDFVHRNSGSCRRAAIKFACVVCVSQPIADALAEAGVPRDRLLVAPAFSSEALPLPLPPAGLAAIARRSDPLVVAVLARGPEYGATVLLEGFAGIAKARPNAGLLLLGPGVRDLSVGARVAALGLHGRVFRFGDLARAEALGAIAAADLFVRPTLADGDAVSVREALALGRRVIASDAAPRPTGTYTFATGHPESLAAAALAALDEPPPSVIAEEQLDPVLSVYESLWESLWESAWGARSSRALAWEVS